jgi:hypothetical protein
LNWLDPSGNDHLLNFLPFASSQPATSAMVLRIHPACVPDLPKLKALPLPPPCICRIEAYTHTPISSSMGPTDEERHQQGAFFTP